jgi:ABC-type sugar transport system permease subunit
LWSWQSRNAPYLFVAPFVLLFCAFFIYPLVRSFVLGFYKTVGPRDERFVGLANYVFLLQDRLFWLALLNTTVYTVVFLVLQIPASLGLAILLNSRQLIGRSWFRFAFFSTNLVGSVFVGLLFSQLFAPRHGLINALLSFFTSEPVDINWLGKPHLAMPATLIAGLWLSVGYGMIYFLAALQAVDRDLYEAAEVDGASPWQKFWHVTLPGIRPVLLFLILVGTIGSFQLFELPYVLFRQGAGPDNRMLTLVMYLYQQGFAIGDLGYASAIGWVLVLIILSVALVQIRVLRMGREA